MSKKNLQKFLKEKADREEGQRKRKAVKKNFRQRVKDLAEAAETKSKG